MPWMLQKCGQGVPGFAWLPPMSPKRAIHSGLGPGTDLEFTSGFLPPDDAEYAPAFPIPHRGTTLHTALFGQFRLYIFACMPPIPGFGDFLPVHQGVALHTGLGRTPGSTAVPPPPGAFARGPGFGRL